jgi:excisionase family DNA binding protein
VRPTASQRPDETLSHLLATLERTSDEMDPGSLQHLLAYLERLKAIVWTRLLSLARPMEQIHAEPLEDLRHLTPIQVGEFLGVKAAYVHELCRTRRIPAIKQGKYWMIPVAELREWLARSRQGIDPRVADSLRSADRPDARRSRSTGRHLQRPALEGAPGRGGGADVPRLHHRAVATEVIANKTENPDSR